MCQNFIYKISEKHKINVAIIIVRKHLVIAYIRRKVRLRVGISGCVRIVMYTDIKPNVTFYNLVLG